MQIFKSTVLTSVLCAVTAAVNPKGHDMVKCGLVGDSTMTEAPIGRQSVITRDNVNLVIDSVIYFQICNPSFGSTDLQGLIELAQTTLRLVVGASDVQSVVTEREAIAFEIAEIVGDVADTWGVAIEGILIKDIIFSAEVSASLSSVALQKRSGESKVEND